MSRIQALLSAGALTGLVLVVIFWWGVGNSEAAAVTTATATTAPATTDAPATVTIPDAAMANSSGSPDMQTLLEQNQQLRETVSTLLDREAEFRRQIETANRQLLSAQRPAGDPLVAAARYQGDDENDEDDGEDDWDDADEDHEHEHEEREHHERDDDGDEDDD